MAYRYRPAARALHWLTAAAVLAQFVFGIWITQFGPKDEPTKFLLYDIHENIGFSLLPITLLRLAIRLANPPAHLPAGIPRMLRFAAHANHAALYLLLIIMPIIGLLATNAWGFPFVWLKLIPIPSPIGRHETLAPLLSTAHWLTSLALGLAILAHLSGVFYHTLIRRDGVLHRML